MFTGNNLKDSMKIKAKILHHFPYLYINPFNNYHPKSFTQKLEIRTSYFNITSSRAALQ